ncbi:Phage integrase family protein [Mariprofundus aestuarium]|uniref:Phage integrase family protein n=1 Tax=Mariprofundus aestuarium TaxID=1921086 RepID=A0A2K8KZE1_MARES|nr:site-specific integrase [Mariprofundus aestuarium]ATX80172.1 Phage integrase family protein [Mariprofundus aestuarium]
MYKYHAFRFPNGERHALLVDADTGKPLVYQNLYITTHHRNKSDSINTIKSVIGALGFFAELCDFLGIDLESRFRAGDLLTSSEIESIALWSKKSKAELSKAKNCEKATNVVPINLKKIELARYTVVIDEDLVCANTTYNRLTIISQYVSWLANTVSPDSQTVIGRMTNRIINHRPVKMPSSGNEPFKSLEEWQRDRLLEIVEPTAVDNPWKNEEVCFRNQLIVHLFLYVGERKGELLSLKATDLDPGKKTICIRRNADDPDDPREVPSLVKTLSRDVEVSDELYLMIEDYIMKYRSRVKGVNKCPYLFVSHQNGASVARPLSHASIDKMFATLTEALGFNVHPHALRHTWNDAFSEQVEPFLNSGEMTESEVEDLRSYLMGWKEGSGTAMTYTKRYQQKKAKAFGLHLQKKVRTADKNRIDDAKLPV